LLHFVRNDSFLTFYDVITITKSNFQKLSYDYQTYFSCTPMIKTDIDSYLQHSNYYRKMDVVFTATIEDLLQRHELYQGKEIEVTAPVTSFGHWNFWTWYLILEKDGKKVRVFESQYRNYPDQYALNLMRVVRSEDGKMTVRGELQRDGIELDRLTYKDFSINTNIKSYRHYYFYY